MAFGMSPFPLRFGSRQGGGGGPWLIPASDGSYVSCYEPTEAVYRAAATALGIAEAVQDIAWSEALLGGSRLYVPQSLATSVVEGVARCELGEDPASSIGFDSSLAACEAMGDNWTLMTQAQWHVVAVISQAYWAGQGKANPTGNTQHGRSSAVTSEVGIRSDGLPVTGSSQGTNGRTLTSLRAVADGGGQLLAWSHDGTATGVFDLVGNVTEWSSRCRLNAGRIEVIPASAGIHADHGVSSTAWRAIRPDGSLVATDAGGDMLHYNTASPPTVLALSASGSARSDFFRTIVGSGVSPIPSVLIALGLMPYSSSVPTVGRLFVDLSSERMPLRGGIYTQTTDAGVSAISLQFARSSTNPGIGFRPAYVAP